MEEKTLENLKIFSEDIGLVECDEWNCRMRICSLSDIFYSNMSWRHYTSVEINSGIYTQIAQNFPIIVALSVA